MKEYRRKNGPLTRSDLMTEQFGLIVTGYDKIWNVRCYVLHSRLMVMMMMMNDDDDDDNDDWCCTATFVHKVG